MDVDLTGLSDDQLIGLLKAGLYEARRRNPGVYAAAEGAMLEETEKVQIQNAAAERESAKLRALERERVAREAEEQVRAEFEANQCEAHRKTQREAVDKAARKMAEKDACEKGWLTRAAELTERKPENISIVVANTSYGRRVMINDGNDRYARTHIVDYYPEKETIKIERGLTSKKIELTVLCAELHEHWKQCMLSGSDYQWEVSYVTTTS